MTVIESFVANARTAFRALVLHVGTSKDGYPSRARRRGAGRLADGRRIVWRFHGAGIYIRLAGQRPVDFDFSGPTGATADDWKIYRCMKHRAEASGVRIAFDL
jgi:hypothetical protein